MFAHNPSLEHVLAPQVAGRFYPVEENHCRGWLNLFFSRGCTFSSIGRPKVFMAPHAGYAYCGFVAAMAYQNLRKQSDAVRKVVLIGPAHRAKFEGVIAPQAQILRMPLGDVPVDLALLQNLRDQRLIGVSDAPFAGEHSLETQLPFLKFVLEQNFEVTPLLVGDVSREHLVKILNEVWGGDETLICISSDLSHFQNYGDAKQKDEVARALIETQALEGWSSEYACGHRILDAMAVVARQKKMRATVVDLKSSGDITGQHEKVVGYGAAVWEYETEAKYGLDDQKAMIGIVRNTLIHGARLGLKPVLNYDFRTPMPLRSQRACFVTLKIDNQLRGCVGTIYPHRSLLNDVAYNAYASGFLDKRFSPVREDEIARIECDISILSSPCPLIFNNEDELLAQLVPYKEGLIIGCGQQRAVYLPTVWQHFPLPQLFLKSLKKKMGVEENFWSNEIWAQSFTCESFSAALA